MVETLRINSGEFVGLSILRITTIPHLSILTDDQSVLGQQCAVAKVGQDFSGMLTESYQQYKDSFLQTGRAVDISFELSWISSPVDNQPYAADVSLYCVIRTIQQQEALCAQVISTYMSVFKATLDSCKYEYQEESLGNYTSGFGRVATGHSAKAIVREERMEDLQNTYLPACYSYDRLPVDYPELDRIANILISHPYSAVCFQLIPTYFTNEELQEINQLNQNISMLSRGVSDQQIGTVSISSADRIASLYHYYNDNKSRALFDYNILVFGEEKDVTSIATRTMGQMAATQQMTAPNLSFVSLTPSEAYLGEQSLFSMPWVLSDQILNKGRNTSLWSSGMVSPALYRLPYIVTADEAASFFRLPVGSDKINAGFVVNEAGKSNKTYSENIINAGDIELGKLRAAMGNNAIGLSLKDLAKHMLIVGTPGSGKTTFSVGLLDRLWKEHHIPFLVIEPAKNEYRALVQSIPDLQVFTPGKNFISPFVFNPFCPPKNVRLETYKSTLKTAFAAGVSMSTPLDKIFEDTINNCYSDFRWLDNYTIADKGQVFNITDFIKCFEETFEEIGYTGDARNIGRAGVVRLKSLVNLFDNYFSIPIEDLLVCSA